MDDATDRLRLAELTAALSLATDLGLGQPMAHALRTCLLAVRLGRVLGLGVRELADTYYMTLLRFVGCTADAHDLQDVVAGDDLRFRQLMVSIAGGTPDEIAPQLARFMTEAGVGGDIHALVRNTLDSRTGIGARMVSAHCEVATMLARRLGFGPAVCDALAHAFERWDGRGFPEGRAGDEIPLPVRITVVARDIDVLARTCGTDQLRDVLRRRRGRAYDPRVVNAFLAHAEDVLVRTDDREIWDEVLRAEPGGPTWISRERLDVALTAFADFADAKTPFTLGHSRGVADLAETAARELGGSDAEAACVRRAGLLHDIGRSGIPNSVWEAPGALSLEQWERVRLHPYYTERILLRCECLRAPGVVAAAHHERLDGSGYHRGSRAAGLDRKARVLGAADACQAMLQPRPHRPARALDEAVRELRADSAAGRLGAQAVEAVIAAAGAPALRHPSGRRRGSLTDREIVVLRLMAQGRSNREMAAALGITPKTVGHHVQHIYDKIAVSTRAAAAVFAVENDLL